MAKRTKSKRRGKRIVPKPWTDQDVIVFKKIYPYVQNSYLSKHFDRSPDSIRKKAIKLGLKKDWAGGYSQPVPKPENPWTRKELETLRRMYPDHTTNEIAEKLGRTAAAVQTKIGDIGLTLNPKINRWTHKETEFIKNNCKNMTLAKMAEKLGKTKSSVCGKLSKLRVLEPGLRPAKPQIGWEPQEDAILRKYFFTWPIKRIARKLKRTVYGVKARGWKLELFKQYRWTDKEIEKLKRLLPKYSLDYIAEKLDRTEESVRAKKIHLGLTKQRPWTRKEIDILRKFYSKEPLKKVAKKLRKKPGTVANKALALRISKTPKRKIRRKKK